MPHKAHRYPSVTQVLGILAKPFLLHWYGKHGTEVCEQIKRESADFGTKIHEEVSQWLKGDSGYTHNWNALAEKYIQTGYKPVEVEPPEPYESKKYKYSGTFDWVDTDGKEYYINDLKITGRIYPEYELQLAAYAQLWNEKYKDKPIQHGKIWRIDKETGKVQVKEYRNLKKVFPIFRSLIKVYNWVNK